MQLEVTALRFARMGMDRSGVTGLARKIGMNPSLLSSIERRNTRCPEKWRPVLASAVGVPVDELFEKHGLALFLQSDFAKSYPHPEK